MEFPASSYPLRSLQRTSVIWDLEIPDLKVQSPFQSRPNTKAARLEALKLLRKPSLREKGARFQSRLSLWLPAHLGAGRKLGRGVGSKRTADKTTKLFPILRGW